MDDLLAAPRCRTSLPTTSSRARRLRQHHPVVPDLGAIGRQIDKNHREEQGPARAMPSACASRMDPLNSSTSASVPVWRYNIVIYLLIVVNWSVVAISSSPPPRRRQDDLFLFAAAPPSASGPRRTPSCLEHVAAHFACSRRPPSPRKRPHHHGDGASGRHRSRSHRFRPVAVAASLPVVGMIPMALGAGEGGEQNCPLGRAVIGGLLLRPSLPLSSSFPPSSHYFGRRHPWERLNPVNQQMTAGA